MKMSNTKFEKYTKLNIFNLRFVYETNLIGRNNTLNNPRRLECLKVEVVIFCTKMQEMISKTINLISK